jgi:aspartate racemase
VPLIHLVDVTAAEIRRQGISTVGLLGTRLTMELDFYANRLRANGVDVIVPDAHEREYINRTIEDELVKSVFLDASREAFVSVIRKLESRGARGVVLGCTEIPLLVSPEQSPIPAFDTTKLHAMAAVAFAMEGAHVALA